MITATQANRPALPARCGFREDGQSTSRQGPVAADPMDYLGVLRRITSAYVVGVRDVSDLTDIGLNDPNFTKTKE